MKKSVCIVCLSVINDPINSVTCICCNSRICTSCLPIPIYQISLNNGVKQYYCQSCSIIYPCQVCQKPCENFPDREASILCDSCNKWEHVSCSKLKISQFNKLGRNSEPYFCQTCISENLPFVKIKKLDNEYLSHTPQSQSNCSTLLNQCSLCIECNDECDTCLKSCPDFYRICNNCLSCNQYNLENFDNLLTSRTPDQYALIAHQCGKSHQP